MRYILILVLAVICPVWTYAAQPREQVLLILHKVPAVGHPEHAEKKGKFDDTHVESRKWGIVGKYSDIINYEKAATWTKGAAEYQVYTLDLKRVDPLIDIVMKTNNLEIAGKIVKGTITTNPRQYLLSNGYEPPPEEP